MEVSEMRAKIATLYPGPNWKYRVSNMPAAQVQAIYFKSVETGTFDKKLRERKKIERENRATLHDQMDIYDWMKVKESQANG